MSFDPMLFVQLGDEVVIDSAAYGRTIGTVYYRGEDRISVKPTGVSNMLHTFHTHEEDGEEVYDEKDGVRAIYIVKKRVVESFVEQQDLRVDHQIDTFDTEGNAYHSYDIVEVKKEEDAIVIRQIGEEETYLLTFDYTGISSDEPFAVISHRPLIKREDGDGDGEAQDAQAQEEQDQEAYAQEEHAEEEEDEIQVV